MYMHMHEFERLCSVPPRIEVGMLPGKPHLGYDMSCSHCLIMMYGLKCTRKGMTTGRSVET